MLGVCGPTRPLDGTGIWNVLACFIIYKDTLSTHTASGSGDGVAGRVNEGIKWQIFNGTTPGFALLVIVSHVCFFLNFTDWSCDRDPNVPYGEGTYLLGRYSDVPCKGAHHVRGR